MMNSLAYILRKRSNKTDMAHSRFAMLSSLVRIQNMSVERSGLETSSLVICDLVDVLLGWLNFPTNGSFSDFQVYPHNPYRGDSHKESIVDPGTEP